MAEASFVPFPTWDAVLAHVRAGKRTWYHAPLDHRPCYVSAKVRGNGRKVRVDPMSRDADAFWADEGHLDRFRWLAETSASHAGGGAKVASSKGTVASGRRTYVTTFCNFAHDVQTGRPIGHECYVLDPKKLKLEMEDRIGEIRGGMPKEPRRTVRGR